MRHHLAGVRENSLLADDDDDDAGCGVAAAAVRANGLADDEIERKIKQKIKDR
jgi:hypothetical protein